jgi:acyl-CoA hydrolase
MEIEVECRSSDHTGDVTRCAAGVFNFVCLDDTGKPVSAPHTDSQTGTPLHSLVVLVLVLHCMVFHPTRSACSPFKLILEPKHAHKLVAPGV